MLLHLKDLLLISSIKRLLVLRGKLYLRVSHQTIGKLAPSSVIRAIEMEALLEYSLLHASVRVLYISS